MDNQEATFMPVPPTEFGADKQKQVQQEMRVAENPYHRKPVGEILTMVTGVIAEAGLVYRTMQTQGAEVTSQVSLWAGEITNTLVGSGAGELVRSYSDEVAIAVGTAVVAGWAANKLRESHETRLKDDRTEVRKLREAANENTAEGPVVNISRLALAESGMKVKPDIGRWGLGEDIQDAAVKYVVDRAAVKGEKADAAVVRTHLDNFTDALESRCNTKFSKEEKGLAMQIAITMAMVRKEGEGSDELDSIHQNVVANAEQSLNKAEGAWLTNLILEAAGKPAEGARRQVIEQMALHAGKIVDSAEGNQPVEVKADNAYQFIQGVLSGGEYQGKTIKSIQNTDNLWKRT